MRETPAVYTRDLHYSYDDRPAVIAGISLTVAQGASMGIVGRNGAGKTTLFMLLCGILRPIRGEISVAGKPVAYRTFNPDIGYVFQNPDDQLFSPTVFDDILFGPINMKFSRREASQRAEEAMSQCGCGSLARRPSHHLSGGEKRMVAIATVLAMRPGVMLYDEPTSNLDVAGKRMVSSLLVQRDTTNLVASHDLEFVCEVCDEVCVLKEGCVAAVGPAREIMARKDLMQGAGLEVPYSLR
ncbi:MAG: ATP-binding cassette domain-containing protein [Chitinivibrionales bacterium]|nr:ATP-binding cassette domain-containing protein [Chitinivibrionales bacterium]MBD3356365.1 ATP-binding cassette domain-containing protein [Chitinivibrionales bacterium]